MKSKVITTANQYKGLRRANLNVYKGLTNVKYIVRTVEHSSGFLSYVAFSGPGHE